MLVLHEALAHAEFILSCIMSVTECNACCPLRVDVSFDADSAAKVKMYLLGCDRDGSRPLAVAGGSQGKAHPSIESMVNMSRLDARGSCDAFPADFQARAEATLGSEL